MRWGKWAKSVMAFALVAVSLIAAAPAALAGQPRIVLPAKNLPPSLPAGTDTRSVSLVNLLDKVDPAKTWAVYQDSLFGCFDVRTVKWRDEPLQADGRDLRRLFDEEVRKTGFKLAGGESFFETERPVADISVAGAINDVSLFSCDTGASIRTEISIDIEWQLYSNVERKVVASVRTRGGDEKRASTFTSGAGDATTSTVRDATSAAFVENFRGLIASKAFRDIVIIPPGGPVAARPSGARITFAARSGAVPVSDAVGSVVAIKTPGGHGSGFLISSDGYVLTNHHVVGTAKTVKVRWSDGRETDGEVLRSDAKRDVALIKTDDRGRQPLGLRIATLQAGETVFAIGAPLEEALQGTVTKGIVSANRIFDGLSYVQSDVSIIGGNSGGPLLDEKGSVVAIAVAGFQISGAPVGVNLFIPVRDALDFLEMAPAAAATPAVAAGG